MTNEPDTPSQPEEAVHFVYRGKRGRELIGGVALVLVLLFPVVVVTIKSSDWSDPCTGFIGSLFLFLAVHKANRVYWSTRSSAVEASAQQLVIWTPRLLGPSQRHFWSRDDIRAIDAWSGLRIVDRYGQTSRLFPAENLAELTPLAHQLRDILRVPQGVALGAVEIAVQFTGTFWEGPMTAVLKAEPGNLILRHALESKPYLCFCRGAVLRNWFAPRVLQLAETDITCRREEDGTAILQIALSDSTCGFQIDGRPEIKFRLFGPFMYESVLLDRGTTTRQDLAATDRAFHLTIWCADNEALPGALGRFWGNDVPQV